MKTEEVRFMKLCNGSIADPIASYFKSRLEAVAVYLFGYYVQGREKGFSDINLGVFLDHKKLPEKNDLYC